MNAPSAALPLIIAPRIRAPRGGFIFEGREYRGGSYLPRSARPALETHASKAARESIADQPVIGILGYGYRVRSIPCSASVGTVAFELIPTDRPTQSYHLFRTNEGEVVCDCGDFTYRKAGTGVMCKHGRGLAELGLVRSTVPKVLPPFALRPAPAALPEPWFYPTPSPTRFVPSPADEVAAAAMLNGGRS